MAGFIGREDQYEKDFGNIIKEIYEDIDALDEELKANANSSFMLNRDLWEEEANELMELLGIDDYKIDLSNIPDESLKTIFRRFDILSDGEDLDDFFMTFDDDGYFSIEKSPEKKLYALGYSLGEYGRLGMCYILLPDQNFFNGYINGKANNRAKQR